jgi:hypothetical protein
LASSVNTRTNGPPSESVSCGIRSPNGFRPAESRFEIGPASLFTTSANPRVNRVANVSTGISDLPITAVRSSAANWNRCVSAGSVSAVNSDTCEPRPVTALRNPARLPTRPWNGAVSVPTARLIALIGLSAFVTAPPREPMPLASVWTLKVAVAAFVSAPAASSDVPL